MPEDIQLSILHQIFTALTEHVQNLSFWDILDAFLFLIINENSLQNDRLQEAADKVDTRLLKTFFFSKSCAVNAVAASADGSGPGEKWCGKCTGMPPPALSNDPTPNLSCSLAHRSYYIRACS
jgi:hypothetical protein